MKKFNFAIAAILSLSMLTACAGNTNTAEVPETSVTVETTASQTETEITTTEETTTTTVTTVTTTETTTEATTEETVPETWYEEPTEAEIVYLDNQLTSFVEKTEDMEFTVDLKSITPETDLFALTNMTALSPEDSPIMVDLDNDGTKEWIKTEYYQESDEHDDFGHIVITINDKKYDIMTSINHTPKDKIYLCDIDSSDNYIEIAAHGATLSNDYYANFFRYENDTLMELFRLSDTPDGDGESQNFDDNTCPVVTGNPIITDGSGVITASERYEGQTWLAYTHYIYDSESGSISQVCEPVYPYYYEELNDYEAANARVKKFWESLTPDFESQKLLQTVTLYKEPDLDSESFEMEPQNVVITAEYDLRYTLAPDDLYSYDYDYWLYVVAEDNIGGWLYCDDYSQSYDYVENIITYD